MNDRLDIKLDITYQMKYTKWTYRLQYLLFWEFGVLSLSAIYRKYWQILIVYCLCDQYDFFKSNGYQEICPYIYMIERLAVVISVTGPWAKATYLPAALPEIGRLRNVLSTLRLSLLAENKVPS